MENVKVKLVGEIEKILQSQSYRPTTQEKEDLQKLIGTNRYTIEEIINVLMNFCRRLTDLENAREVLILCHDFSLSLSFKHTTDRVFSPSEKRLVKTISKILSRINKYEYQNNIHNLTGKNKLDIRDNFEEPEYLKFKRTFKEKLIFTMIQFNREITGYNTIDHITGVHTLAMHIAKQLHQKEQPVELGKVSGAALGHDIGKYACTGPDAKRVPYVHYYYSDLWFKENGLPLMGHIAANHSTWDLEIENLSMESLILIYCDFRVKNVKVDGQHEMTIMDLSESFQTILNMLDNVDDVKEKRYRKVYEKLLDFEKFMISIGVNPQLGKKSFDPDEKYFTLMHGQEIVDNIKHLAISHNTELMYQLRSADSLSALLSTVKNETPENIRTYLDILEEYCTYFSKTQKELTLDFCFEFLTHTEVDIRNQSAIIMSKLIAYYDEEYRKETPHNVVRDISDKSKDLLDFYINKILYPDLNLLEIHKEYLSYGLKILIENLFTHPHIQGNNLLNYDTILLKHFVNIEEFDFATQFNLILTAKYVKSIDLESSAFKAMFNFLEKMINHEDYEVRVATLERIRFLLPKLQEGTDFTLSIIEYIEKMVISDGVAENFLKYQIAKILRLDEQLITTYHKAIIRDSEDISDIFLNNLKSATAWVVKKVNIEVLVSETSNDPTRSLHTALHLCNLLKVSANENVRNLAGSSLLKIIPNLKYDARNDVAVELIRALELQNFNVTKYIPKYLGQVMLYLRPQELDELIDDFIINIKTANTQLGILILDTASIALQHYHIYMKLFKESDEEFNKRKEQIAKILLIGTRSDDIKIKQAAFVDIGDHIFDSKIDLNEKCIIFTMIAKKLLVAFNEQNIDPLLFLSKTSGLINIYRFISDYTFIYGQIKMKEYNKIAFFPGSFDPFTLGHKKIVRQIRDMGYEVYLAIDEFSWSKNTLPHEIRRTIAKLSTACELDVLLFPSGVQINISNNDDIRQLKKAFDGAEVYLVVGSDVVINASSYNDQRNEVFNINHIILERNKKTRDQSKTDNLNSKIKLFKSDVIELELPKKYVEVSSTKIRQSIDEDKDFSDLIDSSAQKYIYRNNLYRKESVLKKLITTKDISVEVQNMDKPLLQRLIEEFPEVNFKRISRLKPEQNPRILYLEDAKTSKIIGFAVFHWIRQNALYTMFKDENITEYIRSKATGRISAIDMIYAKKQESEIDLEQVLLTQTLSFAISRDYNYSIYRPIDEKMHSTSIEDNLIRQGYERAFDKNIFTVSLNQPIALFFDLLKNIKEPFISNPEVLKSIKDNRKRLQIALTKLYPGDLVLPFDSAMIHHSLIKKICDANGVSTEPATPRVLGDLMCVPFGSILESEMIPNTVTKSIHTDKTFLNDGKEYFVGPFPNYMSLDNQVNMIKSFNREVILVDDLLNKGYRIKSLDPLIKKHDVKVERILVGLLSGRGMELMNRQGRKVDYIHFLPNMKLWFNESDLYPFIGGHTVHRDVSTDINILKSTNFVLPYNYPKFIKETSHTVIADLSKTAINNALDIMLTLERAYQNSYNKALCVSLLRDVFKSPRIPDRGDNIDYNMSRKPSFYLKNDLIQLDKISREVK